MGCEAEKKVITKKDKLSPNVYFMSDKYVGE